MIPLFFAAVTAVVAPNPVAPSPDVKLTLATAATDSGWTMRVENTGSVPYLLAADARLLVFDVTPPGATTAVRCALPQDMRPDGDQERALVLPPQRAYREAIDPRMYCFGPQERAALVPGATVVAHLGWIPPNKQQKTKSKVAPTAPFAVTPLDGVEPRVAAAKEISSTPGTLPAPASTAPAPPPLPAAPTRPRDGEASPDDVPTLTLQLPAAGDAGLGTDVSTTLTISNEGPRPVTLLFRMATLAFDVSGPTGSHRCGEPHNIDSPIRELFTTLAPHGHESISVLLGALCPDGTFDVPGLYSVRPVADTRRASGRSIGLRTFDGMIIGQSPQLVRVRHPKSPVLSLRPVLE